MDVEAFGMFAAPHKVSGFTMGFAVKQQRGEREGDKGKLKFALGS